MRQRRLALVLLLTVFTVGMTTRLTLAGPQPVDLAVAINQRHHQATGGWLAGDHALNVYAQALANRLADAQLLSHSNISVLLGCQWGVVAENVGTGPTVEVIVSAFMASPAHALNVTGPYTHLGVGLVERNGQLWAVTIFAQ